MANFTSELFKAYRGEELRHDHYYYYLESQYRRRRELEQEADAVLLMKRFSREEYLCNPKPERISRRTGNGRFTSATSRTSGEFLRGCETLRTSMGKLFVAAGLIALSRLSGESKVTVEWTYHGRDENWKKDLIGMTISSVPVAVDMAAIPSPQALLKEIDEQNEQGMRYSDLSLGNNGVTPGERDRMIVVYESGFDMNAALPEGTEATYAYDRLNGLFTRAQVIIFSVPDPNAPFTFYLNYDSELYTPALAERYCGLFNDALVWMISGGRQ